MIPIRCSCGTTSMVGVDSHAPDGKKDSYQCSCGKNHVIKKDDLWSITWTAIPEPPETGEYILTVPEGLRFVMLTGANGKDYPDSVMSLPTSGARVKTDQGRRILVTGVREITEKEYIDAIK